MNPWPPHSNAALYSCRSLRPMVLRRKFVLSSERVQGRTSAKEDWQDAKGNAARI